MSQVPYLLSKDSVVLMQSKIIATARTEYQAVMFVDTEQFGKMLLIEGATQLSEKDEALYHEAIAHLTLASCKDPKKVLIIGGADGGTLREALKHPIEKATMVDIDGELIELCRKHIPIAEDAFNDERANVIVGDGLKHIKETDEKYDAIILDLSDPEGPSKALFTKEFYESLKRALKERGMIAAQLDSPIVQPHVTGRAYEAMKQAYKNSEIIGTIVPSFFAGNAIAIATDGEIEKDVARIIEQRKIQLRAYTPQQLNELFNKPAWMNQMLNKKWTPSTEKDPAECLPEEDIARRVKEAAEEIDEIKEYIRST